MSGVFKAIGKAFKSVVNVAKKIALPALAIGAAVLTGGAALGVFGPGVFASLGLSQGMTAVLATAGKSALTGALLSTATGGDPIKGATAGFVTGGVLGAAGSVLGTAGKAASTAAQAGQTAASTTGTTAATGALDAVGTAIAAPVSAAAPAIAAAAPTAIGSGILPDFASKALGSVFSNPVSAGMAIQGIGSGIMSATQAAEARRQDAQIRENYAGFGGSSGSTGGGFATIAPSGAPYFAIDPMTGRIIQKAN
ncbi:hypothetical protein [Novosphingobium sp. FKTRR1]|uniref:hypothetical protein n=1 Tax=Novosphingobium sp. FKTRR1 TaxID=2879118 RepID=UPI001CF0B59A|nr:hypothetical protein [Novosphingobium sp. FKTRR1]